MVTKSSVTLSSNTKSLYNQNSMLVKSNAHQLEYETISHSVTLVPRLGYSVNLMTEILQILKRKRNGIKKLNKILVVDFDEGNQDHVDAIKLERTITLSLEILTQIRKRTNAISDVHNIPEILSSSIQMIRTISAQLFDLVPNCSQKLSELSLHLGSIVLDSAALTKARFDFRQSNEESSTLLNEVKLMVDSKMAKQYGAIYYKIRNLYP